MIRENIAKSQFQDAQGYTRTIPPDLIQFLLIQLLLCLSAWHMETDFLFPTSQQTECRVQFSAHCTSLLLGNLSFIAYLRTSAIVSSSGDSSEARLKSSTASCKDKTFIRLTDSAHAQRHNIKGRNLCELVSN